MTNHPDSAWDNLIQVCYDIIAKRRKELEQMPLTSKGKEILKSMIEQYGEKKGTSVFYASINSKKITGAEGSKKKKKAK